VLLQLSPKLGLNTDNVINWEVSHRSVSIWVVGQGCSVQGPPSIVLNAAEGYEFLQHAHGPSTVLLAIDKLTGKETDDGEVNAE